jgi:ATP-binding cassette subfamily F protein uup
LQKQSEYRRNDRQVGIGVTSSRLGKKILVLDKISQRFGEKTILDAFSYTFTRGEKLGIIGSNGVGKSTFLNIITGLMEPGSGTLEQGETVNYGYYQQKGLEFMSGQRVIDIVQDIAEVVSLGNGQQLPVSQFLNQFLFTPEMQHIQVDKLSGGEKRRLYLMTVLMRSPNFLILDEPTNDFDLVTLNVLEEYLLNFEGCVVIVSHDRFFMDKIVDHLFIFEGDGMVYDFPGNYSDYRASEKQQQISEKRKETQTRSKATVKPINEPDISSKKKRSFREKREFEQLTVEIDALEKEKIMVESALTSGRLKTEELIAQSNRIAEILHLIEQKTDRWLELSEKGS